MKIKKLLVASLLLALMAGNVKAQTNTPFLIQGFEDGMAGWSFQGQSAVFGKIVSDYVHSGLKCFRLQYSSVDYGYLISPELNSSDTEDGVGVSFYYNNRFLTVPTGFKVGYSMTTSDPMAFTWGDLVSADSGSWTAYEKSFPANVKYIAIAFPIIGGYLYIDDIVLSGTDCTMPTIPSVSNVASDAISVEWMGTAQGLRCSTLQEYGFEDETNTLSGWSSLGGGQWQWSGNYGIGHKSSHCVLSDVTDNYLVSPLIALNGRITFYARGVSNSFKGSQRDNGFHLNFKVMVTTEENPTVDSFVLVPGAVFEASADGWRRYTIDLSAYSGQEGHVAIYHCNAGAKGEMVSGSAYWLAVDDITLFTLVQETHELIGNSYAIEGLDEMTKCAIQLQGCNQWTDALYVATLPAGGIDTYVFVRKGHWNEIDNWENWYMPSEGDNVFMKAKARIPANYVAKAGTITFLNGGDPLHPSYLGSITVADGGQLRHSSRNVRVTMEKNIIGYTGEKDNYKLLAFPTANDINLSAITIDNILHHFITSSTFDLYKFDHSQDLEWINFENGSHPFTLIQNGVGYLYANTQSDRYEFNISNLKPSNNNVTKNLAYISGKAFSGWNLLGNPFACNAYLLDGNDFYRLQEVEGESKIVLAENNAIAPMEGIFVVASTSGESVTFTADEPRGGSMMDFTLRKAFMRSDVCLDRARVRFSEGQNMGHFDLMADPNRLYIPLDGKAMAVVNTQPIGELPLNFEAASDGTFVLGFTNKAEGLAYCHLIDNLTGADIDLLQQPEYTFDAKSNNYASRFRVVFVAKDASTGSATDDSETFAYNSNGSWIIVNEDQATLQVVDVQGRILSSETIEGCVSKNIQAAPGVYMLRLVKGENVKVQKVVVR